MGSATSRQDAAPPVPAGWGALALAERLQVISDMFKARTYLGLQRMVKASCRLVNKMVIPPSSDYAPCLVRELKAQALSKNKVPNVVFKQQLVEVSSTLAGFDPKVFNIGIVGATKAGKSSLVNALLLAPPGTQYAEVGVAECTSKPKMFTSPFLPYVRLWDMPGAGTPKFPAAGFYHKQALYAMDLLLLVYKDTVSEVFLNVIQAAAERRQSVVIVRTNSVPTARSIMSERSVSAEDALLQLRREVRSNLRENLGGLGVPVPEVYIVDRFLFSDQAAVQMYDTNDAVVLTLSRAEKTDEERLMEFLAETNRTEAPPSGSAAGQGPGPAK